MENTIWFNCEVEMFGALLTAWKIEVHVTYHGELDNIFSDAGRWNFL